MLASAIVFQLIEGSTVFAENMHDYIDVIKQNPFRILKPSLCQGFVPNSSRVFSTTDSAMASSWGFELPWQITK